MGEMFDPVTYAKKCIEEKMENLLPEKVEMPCATVDMKKLKEITSMGRTYLETNFTCLPQVRELDVSVTTKKLWLYPEVANVWRKHAKENRIRKLEE